MSDIYSNNGFRKAGDLDRESDYFRKAGDLTGNIRRDTEIKDYLLTVVSGKRQSLGDDYLRVAGGKTIVSFEQLKEMVNDGYNIISANYIRPMGMVDIEFEKYEKREGRHR